METIGPYIPDAMFAIAFLFLGIKMYQTIGMLNRRTFQDPKLNPLQKDSVNEANLEMEVDSEEAEPQDIAESGTLPKGDAAKDIEP